jgi:endonuclease/exonuclease/phosphatase (EEP) superfamily protein YafD
MPSMLEANSYDTICHEHLEYYSLAVIENFLRRADFHAFRATFNLLDGGSIRVYPTHASNFKFKTPAYAEELHKLRQQKFDLEQ